MSDLQELYQSVILDHNRKPRNFGVLDGANRAADGKNPLCGDEVHVALHVDGDVITDVKFTGHGCAISKASASLMTAVVKGKTREEVTRTIQRYLPECQLVFKPASHLWVVTPSHVTELLAHLTGTEEVSMMLSTPKLKVIHVTTHIGLLDAVARIEPGLVERTIRRGHEALVRTGNPSPKIGVCGINPHAGENGLFGYGEEEQKIIPAVELLKAEGIDIHGPLPADTAFFLAGRGDYDLIVAMYHDQGHGPVKVLGIEAGVNITVGLPVIRTSVDHGTAFDIAGKGIAEAGSMVEALRQAAELATSTFVSK